MTKTKYFGFKEEDCELTITEITEDGKVHASFDAVAEDGSIKVRKFTYNPKTTKIRDESGKVTSKDEALNQAGRFLASKGEVGRVLLFTEHQLNEKDAEIKYERGLSRASEHSKDNWQIGGALAATGLVASLIGGIAITADKDFQIAGLEDTIDQQNNTINAKNTFINDLAGDLADKNVTIKWHQDGWKANNETMNATINSIMSEFAGDLADKTAILTWHQEKWAADNKTIVDSGLYQAGWNAAVDDRKNETLTYITNKFNDTEISAVTSETLTSLTLEQLFDVALELEHNEGDAEGYQKAIDVVGGVLAAEGIDESDYTTAGLIERLVLYGEHVVSENGTFSGGYGTALQEAVSVADDILGAAKAGKYDNVEALVKAYGEAVAAEALELADYNDDYVIDAINANNWTKANEALTRLANLHGGMPTIQPDNATLYQRFMANVSDEQKGELDSVALGSGYSSFTDMYNQGFGFYAVDTFGPGAVIVAYDSDTKVAGKISQSLYDKIKSQGE